MQLSATSQRRLLVHGHEQGRAAWYVVQVEPRKVPLLEKMLASETYDLPRMGTVLHAGWGEMPPEDILAELHGA